MLPISPSKPIQFNSIEIPKEIFLQHIVPFLTKKEILIASFVAHAWHDALQTEVQKIDIGKVFAKILQDEDSKSLVSFKDVKNPPISKFIFANRQVCLFNRSYGDSSTIFSLTLITASGELKNLPPNSKVLCKGTKTLLIFERDGENLIGINKETGAYLFSLKAQELCSIEKDASEVPEIFNAHILSEDPLIFLVVFSDGTVAKWEFKDQKAHLFKQFKIENVKEIRFSGVHAGTLFIAGSIYTPWDRYESSCFFSKYECKTLKKIGINYNDDGLSFCFDSWVKKAVVDNQLIKLDVSNVFLYDLHTGNERWQVPLAWAYCSNFLIPPSSKWIIVYGYVGWEDKKLNIGIISTETGKIQNSYSFEFGGIRTAKILGSVLFLVFSNGIEAVDLNVPSHLQTSTLATWTVKNSAAFKLTQDSNLFLLDAFFSGTQLFLLLKDKIGQTFVEVIDVGTESVKSWPIPQELKEESAPQVSLLSSAEKPQIQSSKSKVMAIALGIFTVLLLAGAAFAYYRGAINLSIGLGISSLVSATSSGFLGAYHLKQKNQIS